jgi:hypothetical protein
MSVEWLYQPIAEIPWSALDRLEKYGITVADVHDNGVQLVSKSGSVDVQPHEGCIANIWIRPPGAFDVLRAMRREFGTEFRVCEDPIRLEPTFRDAKFGPDSAVKWIDEINEFPF